MCHTFSIICIFVSKTSSSQTPFGGTVITVATVATVGVVVLEVDVDVVVSDVDVVVFVVFVFLEKEQYFEVKLFPEINFSEWSRKSSSWMPNLTLRYKI